MINGLFSPVMFSFEPAGVTKVSAAQLAITFGVRVG